LIGPAISGLVTYYVLLFIHLESRRVDIAGITIHPDEPWMRQIARNVTMEGCGTLRDCRYLLHDRDTKYTQSFRAIIASGRVEPLALPPECLCGALGQVGEGRVPVQDDPLRRALPAARTKDNVLLFPRDTDVHREGPVQGRERLGGLLRYYHQEVA
jgi:putative transposase